MSQPQKRYPIVGVAVIVRDEGGRVLLGRRAQGRYGGLWCIPCGRLEWGEEVRDGAKREFLEETGVEVRITGIAAVHSNFHNPDDLSVGIWFAGEIVSGEPYCADGELSEIGWFAPDAPPPLAFPTDEVVLGELGPHPPAPTSSPEAPDAAGEGE